MTVVIGAVLPEHLQRQFTGTFPDHRFIFCESSRMPEHLPDADVLIAWGFTPTDIENAKKLKWVQSISAGVDRIDGLALRDRGIPLTNSSGIHANNIAEHILSLMLSFARRLPALHDLQREHRWHSDSGRSGVFEITGQTLLVVGLGKIGEALAKRAKGLEMNVIATRRRLDIQRPSAADEVIPLSELKTRIGEADHVAICLPLTKNTEGMFDAGMLAAMKDGAYIYNIGRGSIIDQDALIHELSSGRLGGAGLDVTTPEPLPAESPLWNLPNVIITPHTSGSSPKLMERAVPLWVENLRRFSNGDELLNQVDVEAGY
jgi:phosphoglycerate dehydrogenase-like enzyme